MAVATFLPLSLPTKPATRISSPSPSISFTATNSESFPGRRKSLLSTSANPNPSPELGKPYIELEFIGPKVGVDGSYPVDSASAISGEKLLRNIMIDNKIELYAAYIVNGRELLNERTDTEKRYLKKKPESWRLACQTIIGNKENSGKVIVQRLPQWKK